MQEMQVWSLEKEDPLEQEMAPTPVLLPGESHGQQSLADCSPWGLKVRHSWVTACTYLSVTRLRQVCWTVWAIKAMMLQMFYAPQAVYLVW